MAFGLGPITMTLPKKRTPKVFGEYDTPDDQSSTAPQPRTPPSPPRGLTSYLTNMPSTGIGPLKPQAPSAWKPLGQAMPAPDIDWSGLDPVEPDMTPPYGLQAAPNVPHPRHVAPANPAVPSLAGGSYYTPISPLQVQPTPVSVSPSSPMKVPVATPGRTLGDYVPIADPQRQPPQVSLAPPMTPDFKQPAPALAFMPPSAQTDLTPSPTPIPMQRTGSNVVSQAVRGSAPQPSVRTLGEFDIPKPGAAPWRVPTRTGTALPPNLQGFDQTTLQGIANGTVDPRAARSAANDQFVLGQPGGFQAAMRNARVAGDLGREGKLMGMLRRGQAAQQAQPPIEYQPNDQEFRLPGVSAGGMAGVRRDAMRPDEVGDAARQKLREYETSIDRNRLAIQTGAPGTTIRGEYAGNPEKVEQPRYKQQATEAARQRWGLPANATAADVDAARKADAEGQRGQRLLDYVAKTQGPQGVAYELARQGKPIPNGLMAVMTGRDPAAEREAAQQQFDVAALQAAALADSKGGGNNYATTLQAIMQRRGGGAAPVQQDTNQLLANIQRTVSKATPEQIKTSDALRKAKKYPESAAARGLFGQEAVEWADRSRAEDEAAHVGNDWNLARPSGDDYRAAYAGGPWSWLGSLPGGWNQERKPYVPLPRRRR